MSAPSTLSGAFRKAWGTFEHERRTRDAAVKGLLRRWAAALLREHAGLNVLALAVFVGEDCRPHARAFVETDEAFADAWREGAFRGGAPAFPSNAGLAPEERTRVQAVAERFLPALLRLHGGGSMHEGQGTLLAFWRAPDAPDGVGSARGYHDTGRYDA